jgi:RHS repeat-associated protein
MNLRFAGQYFDEEVGTHYNYYRDYQPKFGRYIESDPFGLSGGLNLFVYAEQSPLDVYDNNGLAPKYVKPDNPNKRKPPDHRIPSGERERNVGHENAEEHSRQSKKQRGSGVKGSRGARGVGGLLIWDIVNDICNENPSVGGCGVIKPPPPIDPC